MLDKRNYIHTIFSVISKKYDLLNSLLSLKLDKSWREFAVSVSGLQPDSRVLDVCTGTGELALTYAKALSYKKRVIGTDFCHEMLLMCKKKLKMKRIGRALGVIETDTLCLPFQDKSFDVASAAFGIRNLTDIKRGIKEMVRVVTCGGCVVILEFTQPIIDIHQKPSLLQKLGFCVYYLYFVKMLPLIGNAISQNQHDAYGYLPNSVMNFPDKECLKEIMQACGLRDVEVYTKFFGVVAIHVGRK